MSENQPSGRQEEFLKSPVFSKNDAALTPSEIQWIYSGDGGGTPEVEGGPRVAKVRRYIASLPAGKKILDVGCANGAILKPLGRQHELHGVDISEVFVCSTLSRIAFAGFHAAFN